MTKSVLKWQVEINDDVQEIGAGKVVYTGLQGSQLCVWTEEASDFMATGPKRKVVVHGTGHPILDSAVHIGSVIDPPFVWHLYDVTGLNDD